MDTKKNQNKTKLKKTNQIPAGNASVIIQPCLNIVLNSLESWVNNVVLTLVTNKAEACRNKCLLFRLFTLFLSFLNMF